MMRRVIPRILLSLLVFVASGLQCRRLSAATPPSDPSAPMLVIDGLLLTPWLPGESYQGGEQFDERLEKPVRFWRAAAPLQDVFTDLSGQTGVSLSFWPPQTDEPRVPVTLYLNPQKPPSLREVMAQLAWVTGCAFALSDGVDGRAYYLLGTSAGRGVAEKLSSQQQAQQEQFRAAWQTRQDTQREDASRQLTETKAALALSDGEAIARYRGKNDALLLNLLDHPRRAAVTLLAGLPDDDVGQLLNGSGGLTRDWSGWSPDQQAAIKQALSADENWPAEVTITITVDPMRGGALTAHAPGQQRRRPVGRVTGLLSSGDVTGRNQIALLRLVGEIQTPEQEDAVRKQQQDARQADRAAQQEQFAQRRVEALAATRTLSEGKAKLLTSLSLPDLDGSADLWKLQEAVAKATGLHVVSDCFWPPRFGGPRQRNVEKVTNTLEALSSACAPTAGFPGPGFGGGRGPGGGAPGPGPGGGGATDLSVRWGDAGTFLRFRSQSPDMWRGALLPADVLAQLDAWLEPAVSASSSAAPPPGDTPLSSDLEKVSWLAGRLNDLQARLGGTIPYEDPSEPKGARRQELRRGALAQIAFTMPLLRLLASFTLEQWARARADGLRWGYDLTPDQQASDGLRGVASSVSTDRVKDIVIKIGQTEARTFQQRDGTPGTIPPVPAVTFSLDGAQINQVPLGGGFRGFGGGPGGGGPGGGGPGGRGGPGGGAGRPAPAAG